nr:MAG TPA: Protein of unknown function (DUF2718) [Caudoviricetes sp.]
MCLLYIQRLYNLWIYFFIKNKRRVYTLLLFSVTYQ